MEKETTLFYLCDKCKAVNLILPEYEVALPYVRSLKCHECNDVVSDVFTINKLRWFSKATRPQA